MRKLGLALCLLLLGLAPAQPQPALPPVATQASVTFGAQVARTQIIAAKTGQRIYVTSLVIHPANTAVVTLSYGTGTDCATGTTVFYGPATFQAGENMNSGSGSGAVFVVPVSNAVCITITTANAPGWLSYAQF